MEGIRQKYKLNVQSSKKRRIKSDTINMTEPSEWHTALHRENDALMAKIAALDARMSSSEELELS